MSVERKRPVVGTSNPAADPGSTAPSTVLCFQPCSAQGLLRVGHEGSKASWP